MTQPNSTGEGEGLDGGYTLFEASLLYANRYDMGSMAWSAVRRRWESTVAVDFIPLLVVPELKE